MRPCIFVIRAPAPDRARSMVRSAILEFEEKKTSLGISEETGPFAPSLSDFFDPEQINQGYNEFQGTDADGVSFQVKTLKELIEKIDIVEEISTDITLITHLDGWPKDRRPNT